MPKTYNFSNPERINLIRKLEKAGKKENARIWKKVSDELSKSRKFRRKVNLWKINKYSRDNEIVLIPGKVLGYGNLNHKVKVSAFKFSKTAKEKIENSGGEALLIEELIKINPKGSGVKILG
jgi:large subunit ribosomal protein L18e